MSSAFVAEIARRLQGQSAALAMPLNWIEQRLSELGLSIEQLVQSENQQQAADQVSISNSIGSLRFLGAMDWREFVETMSVVELKLREDPDGMAVDAQGLLWVASARAGCVARLTPDGEIDRVLEVPAQTVTSLCFAGGDQHDLYVVTADNTDVPGRRGTIFRVTAGVGGAPVHPARI